MRTRKGITKLAEVIGWTPDEPANHLLAETLAERIFTRPEG
jgi:hypothetical protein